MLIAMKCALPARNMLKMKSVYWVWVEEKGERIFCTLFPVKHM